MKKRNRLLPIVAGLLLVPATQIFAVEGLKNANQLLNKTTIDFSNTPTTAIQKMYLIQDCDILQNNQAVSSTLERQLVGSSVSVMEVEGNMAKVLTSTGAVGYVSIDKLTSQIEYVFINENVPMYINADDVALLDTPSDYATAELTLDTNTELQLTGSNEQTYWRVVYEGNTYYVNRDELSSTKKFIPKTVSYVTPTSAWNGSALTPFAGTIVGPSGKETYYNLNMNGVVQIMRNMGNNEQYWVREDGVKMLGDYVMVAADLSIHPRGSLVQTSLGMGLVCDTGSFIYSNPYQLDIAVAW